MVGEDVNLDRENEVVHSLDVAGVLRGLRDLEVIFNSYRERVDESPFRHKHLFNVLALRKR